MPEIPPTVAEQIAANAEAARKLAQSVVDRADAGDFDGPPGEASAEFKALVQQAHNDVTAIAKARGEAETAVAEARTAAIKEIEDKKRVRFTWKTLKEGL